MMNIRFKSKNFIASFLATKLSAIGLIVCSSLTPLFVISESSYADNNLKNNNNFAFTKQNSKARGNFSDFKYQLARRETGEANPSYNNTKNQWGFIGKYQFGEALLIDLGYYQAQVYYGKGADRNNWQGTWTGKDGINSKQDFLNNKNNAQERAIDQAFGLQLRRLKAQLQQNGRSIQDFLGKRVGQRGIVVTPSGLLAASHLRGPGATAQMLLSGTDSRDETGTSIFTYLEEFAGYELPHR